MNKKSKHTKHTGKFVSNYYFDLFFFPNHKGSAMDGEREREKSSVASSNHVQNMYYAIKVRYFLGRPIAESAWKFSNCVCKLLILLSASSNSSMSLSFS